MATKSKKSSPKKVSTKASDTNVTRIKASDTAPVAVTAKKLSKKVTLKSTTKKTRSKKRPLSVLIAIGGYFKGAWFELRQVRWPNRKATWSLTAAVLIFTAFFVLLVVLLDILFKYLFQLILG